jgi:hypothetical protein
MLDPDVRHTLIKTEITAPDPSFKFLNLKLRSYGDNLYFPSFQTFTASNFLGIMIPLPNKDTLSKL